MFYKFYDPNDFDCETILKKIKELAPNKNDISDDVEQIKKMIRIMLPRKEENLYAKINSSNIANHLLSFIPSDSIDEIKKKAELDDPVLYLVIFV